MKIDINNGEKDCSINSPEPGCVIEYLPYDLPGTVEITIEFREPHNPDMTETSLF